MYKIQNLEYVCFEKNQLKLYFSEIACSEKCRMPWLISQTSYYLEINKHIQNFDTKFTCC